jgi:hypothetical protein
MSGTSDYLLFSAVANELRLPLLQIARLSELPADTTTDKIGLISTQALQLVDAYVQAQTQTALALEPINSRVVLQDVATALQPYAKQADFVLEIDYQGLLLPVMANRGHLTTMLTLLGMSLIEAATEDEDSIRHLVLGSHRSAKGTVIGAFSSHVQLNQQALEQNRSLYGRASQAMPQLGQAGSAGLAIADRLSQQMQAPLKTYRHRSLTGIGSLLVPSRQLQLVA